uniref:Uncharacterized protein n=1 Tax=Globodera rostochiensis TaxID=31243 RepID=A0A914HYI9_GLORO
MKGRVTARQQRACMTEQVVGRDGGRRKKSDERHWGASARGPAERARARPPAGSRADFFSPHLLAAVVECNFSKCPMGETSVFHYWAKRPFFRYWAKCPMGEMSMGEMSMGEMSNGRNVYGRNVQWAKCLWAKCPMGEMSVGEMSNGRNVYGRNVYGRNVQWAKWMSCLKPKPGTESQKDLSASFEKMKKSAVVDGTNASNEDGSVAVGTLFSMVEEMQTAAKTFVDSANAFNEDSASNLLQKYAVGILCRTRIENFFEKVGKTNFNDQFKKQTGETRENLCKQLENIDESVLNVEKIKNKFVENLHIDPQMHQNLIKVTENGAFSDENKNKMSKLIGHFIQGLNTIGPKLKESKQYMTPFMKLPHQKGSGKIRRKRDLELCGQPRGCMQRWSKPQKCIGGIVFGSISAALLVMTITLVAQHPELVNRHPLPPANFIAMFCIVVLMIACILVFVISSKMEIPSTSQRLSKSENDDETVEDDVFEDPQESFTKLDKGVIFSSHGEFKKQNVEFAVSRLVVKEACIFNPENPASTERQIERCAHDYVTVRWRNAPDLADAARFMPEWFHVDGMQRRKRIAIEYNI